MTDISVIKNGGNYNGNSKSECKFEEVEISVPWGHISAKWWGPKTIQPIIALHGWQDNSGTFDNLAPLLVEKGLSLLCIDFPGHGFSSPLPRGLHYYLWWDGVQYIRRIVKYFNWKRITLIGHSMGGGIAFIYASAYPDEVEKYVNIDMASPAVLCPAKMISLIGDSVDKLLIYEERTDKPVPCYEYEDMVDIMEKAHAGSVTRKSCEILLRRGMRLSKDKKRYLFTRDPRLKFIGLGHITIEQALHMAELTKCEVLNIKATTRLKQLVPEYYDLVLDKLEVHAKRVERHIVEGTHHLHLNDAESVAPIIHNFLKS